MNKYTGVIGVYNCQGAAWSQAEKKNVFHQTGTKALRCKIRGSDVHLISEASTDADWKGDCVVYRYSNGDLFVLSEKAAVSVSLKVLEHEIFTVTPLKDFGLGYRFAPLGLIDMYNGGGAVEGLTYHRLDGVRLVATEDGSLLAVTENVRTEAVGMVCLEVKGCGRFGSYFLLSRGNAYWVQARSSSLMIRRTGCWLYN